MTKYIYGAIIIALVLIGVLVNNLVDTVANQKATIKEQAQEVSNLTQANKDQLQQALKDNAESIKHLHRLSELENEANTLRSDLNSGLRVVRVKATCPQLPNVEPNATGVTSTSPELTPDARAGYVDLIREIKEASLLLVRCQKRVIEDYEKCGAKVGDAK